MIITRSPLRISFAGGGTDVPAFYRRFGPGAVVSTSINRYVYVTVSEKFDGKVSIRYRIHEAVDSVDELKHPMIREILLGFGIRKGVEIVIASEVPARGSGLGASSALACALIKALDVFTGAGETMNKAEIAEVASGYEIDKVGSPIGKQDHYASAFGGLNFFQFNQNESVLIKNYKRDEFVKELEDQSMLFYLNIEHEYHGGSFVQKILRDQNAQIEEKLKMHRLQRENALRLWEHMEYAVMERFMDHVNENWNIKKRIHEDISNTLIDDYMVKAFSAGATAGKVCGAGGGGFMYLIVPPSMQDNVRKSLEGLHELTFKFDELGTQCIFSDEKGKHAIDKS